MKEHSAFNALGSYAPPPNIVPPPPPIRCNALLASAIGLLRIARCPNCEGEGWYVREVGGCDSDGENDTRECVQEQCQWCYEREGLLAEYDKANT